MEDTERGIIIPRLTTAQRDAIPAADLTVGVIIYNKDCHRLEWWDGSQWVAVVTSTTLNTLPTPMALSASGVTGGSFTANWQPVSGASGYQVVVSQEADFSTLLPGYPMTVSGVSHVVTGLNCGVYYYRVRAYSQGCNTGYSEWSNVQMVLIAPNLPACTPNTSIQLPDPPSTIDFREKAIAAAVGMKIYMGFGYNTDCLNDWWEWDICTGQWTQRASPPVVVGGRAFCLVLNDQVYVGATGWPCAQSAPEVYRYDPATDTWTQVASLPSVLYEAVGASDGRYGYVLGGWNGVNSFNTLYRYDPVTDSWSTLAPYPAQYIISPALGYVNGALYVTQGVAPPIGNPTSASYCYDVVSHSWVAITAHPYQDYGGWGISMNGRFYVLGSWGCTPFHFYDPSKEYMDCGEYSGRHECSILCWSSHWRTYIYRLRSWVSW